MFCPKCGKELDSNNVCSNPSCPSYNDNNNHANQNFEVNNQNIGAHTVNSEQYNNQNHINYGYNQSYTSPQNFNSPQFNTNGSFRDKNGISTEELMQFVGEPNAHYYLEQWQKSQYNENFTSWNWPAFFGGFLWFWYRKMYGLAGIIFAATFALRLLVSILFGAFARPSLYYSSSYFGGLYSNHGIFNLPANIIGLIISIVCALFANQLYIKFATKKIASVKATSSMGIDDASIFRGLGLTGGTTMAPIIFIIVVVVIFVLIFAIALIGLNRAFNGYGSYY